MIRQLILATLAAFALGGCATDYAYRGGTGDYYYGQPSVQYRDYYYGYGAPYSSIYGYGYPYWRSGLSIGIGYGYGGYRYPYGYYGGGYPYGYYPWYRHGHDHNDHDQRPPRGPTTGGRLPPTRVGDDDPPRGAASVVPRNGARPMPLPTDRSWRGRERIGRPYMSRPAPQAVRRPAPGRVKAVRPAPPRISRPAPPVVRQPAPVVRSSAAGYRPPAPRASRPSARSRKAPYFRERERVREE